MKKGDLEIKGTGSCSNGESVKFTGSFTKKKPPIAVIKKGDPIKVYHSDAESYDAIVTSIFNNLDGSQTIFFKNRR